MKVDAIAFVESPLQILNAMEAISYFKIEKYQLVVRLSGLIPADNQLIKTIELLSLESSSIKFIKVGVPKRTFLELITVFTTSVYYQCYVLFFKYKVCFYRESRFIVFKNCS